MLLVVAKENCNLVESLCIEKMNYECNMYTQVYLNIPKLQDRFLFLYSLNESDFLLFSHMFDLILESRC